MNSLLTAIWVRFRCASALLWRLTSGSKLSPRDRAPDAGAIGMNTPRPISLVLADDHPVVLHGIAAILQSQPDIHVVALWADGMAAVKAIRLHVPDVAVLDISMPGMTGLDVLSTIRSEGLSTKIVFLSAAASDGQILTASDKAT
jgi:CheY-like chemotaxis protein